MSSDTDTQKTEDEEGMQPSTAVGRQISENEEMSATSLKGAEVVDTQIE